MNSIDFMNYNHLTIEQLNEALRDLTFLTTNIILSESDVAKHKEKLMNAKDKKILESYPIRTWQANTGVWKAHVPDSTKDRGRRVIEGKTKEVLENKILKDYYKRFDDRLVFANYFAEWLVKEKSKHVQPATLQRNFDDYKRFIAGTQIDKMNIANVKTLDIENLLNSAINKHHLTKKALGNLKSLFSGMYKFALKHGDIQTNPMDMVSVENSNIRTPKKPIAKTEVFNKEELPALTDYIAKHYKEHSPMVSLAILLNFQLGLRVGELCALKKCDVDFENQCISIDRTEASYRPIRLENGKLVKEKTVHEITEERTKAESNRIIELTDYAIEIINVVLQLHKELALNTEFLFADKNGNHIIRQRINDCLEYYCEKLSINRKSSHKIRKTFISNLFRNGFDIDEVMNIAGHSVKATTIDHYLFSLELEENRRERLNKAVGLNQGNLAQPDTNPPKIA